MEIAHVLELTRDGSGKLARLHWIRVRTERDRSRMHAALGPPSPKCHSFSVFTTFSQTKFCFAAVSMQRFSWNSRLTISWSAQRWKEQKEGAHKTFKKWPNSRRKRNANSWRHLGGLLKRAFLTNAKKALILQNVYATDTEHSFWFLDLRSPWTPS